MGILNVTPDSFSDGGHFLDLDTALAHARQMSDDGARIIDVGGESTRPGAEPVSVGQELDRVVPVVEGIRNQCDVLISIDTSKPEVMREAVQAGAGFINDVRALRDSRALETAAALEVAVCLMHMQGDPKTMQTEPHYQDVVREVGDFLEARALDCESAGISTDRIVVDPGFGFGKTFEHNLSLMSELDVLTASGRPLLVGVSRKSMIGKMVGNSDDRVAGSVSMAMLAAIKGASILRVHDVRPTVDALAVLNTLRRHRSKCARGGGPI